LFISIRLVEMDIIVNAPKSIERGVGFECIRDSRVDEGRNIIIIEIDVHMAQ